MSSEEVKAVETLQCLSPQPAAIMQDPRFNEVRRQDPFDEDFMSRRRAWIEGELDRRHARWERPHEAADRFDRAVRDYAASEQRLVIGSHGMVITAWLIGRGHVRAGADAGRFWEALAFPDLVTVDID